MNNLETDEGPLDGGRKTAWACDSKKLDSLESKNSREIDSWPTSDQTGSLILLYLLDLRLYSSLSAIYELRELEHVICVVSDLQCPHLSNGDNNTYVIQSLWRWHELLYLGRWWNVMQDLLDVNVFVSRTVWQ